jgi:hypothetical protein
LAQLATYLRKVFARPAPNAAAIQEVKRWAREALQTAPDTAFAVNEIACTDPSCPGVETVILVMTPGVKTRACKIRKALDEVTEQDVREALTP